MTFDEIKSLIKTFSDSSLTELKIRHDETDLTLRRRVESNPIYTQPMMVHPQAMAGGGMMAGPATSVPQAAGAPAEAAGAATEEEPIAAGVEIITSPIVGTFYRSPSPDSPPFCHEGDVVQKGSPLCILEAMKVMNELEAEFAMEIVAFKAQNGDMVEYGTPLLEVRRI